MESEIKSPTNYNWSISVLVMLGLLFGLWLGVKSCYRSEMNDRLNGAIHSARVVVDSASGNVENAAKSIEENLDSAARVFKTKWSALGQYVDIKLGEYYFHIPQNGMELKLLQWLQQNTTVNRVEKQVWFNFDRILFEPGSAKLNTVSDEQIKNIFSFHYIIPTLVFKIGGYTDNTGNPEENKKLSLDRANAVRYALIQLGGDSTRLQTEGYGQENPIADNNTEAGREQNRRIAITVVKK
jgi:outer membrane protein OmpA-like peptidoglycan-associated protein